MGLVQSVLNYKAIPWNFSGVPQGSVLGQLLFLIFVEDLSKIPISSSLLLFADDSKCFQVIESHSDCSLQDSLDKVLQWNEEWDHAFNTSKTNLVQFSRKSSSHPAYRILLEILGSFSRVIYLGPIHYSILLLPRPIRLSVC